MFNRNGVSLMLRVLRSSCVVIVLVLLVLTVASCARGDTLVTLGSSFSIDGRVFVLQRISTGMNVLEWNRGSRYDPVAVTGLGPFTQPLAITPLLDRSIAILASENGAGQSLWRITITTANELSAERMTPLMREFDGARAIEAASPGRFIVSSDNGVRVIGGSGVVCGWRFGPPAFALAVRGNDVLVARGLLQRIVLGASGCPESQSVISDARVTGVVAVRQGWIMLMKRGLHQAIVALDASLRPRWVVRLPPRGWLLTASGAEAAIAWSPAERRAYKIGADSVIEEILPPGDDAVDMVRGAVANRIRFATDHGVLEPLEGDELRPSRAIPLPLTTRFATPGELAAVLVLLLSIFAVGLFLHRR